MNILICFCVIASSITFAIVSARSALAPEINKPEVKSNVIVFEVLPAGDESAGAEEVKVEGDRLYLEGRNFSSLDELSKILKKEKKARSEVSGSTPAYEPYTLVVPVARNFSSLKELFEILKNDDNSVSRGVASHNQSYVKGTEVDSSDYTFLLTL